MEDKHGEVISGLPAYLPCLIILALETLPSGCPLEGQKASPSESSLVSVGNSSNLLLVYPFWAIFSSLGHFPQNRVRELMLKALCLKPHFLELKGRLS